MPKDKWSDAEHKALAAKMFAKWKEFPLDNPTHIAKEIMAKDWPEDRRKKIIAVSATGMRKAYTEFTRLIREFMSQVKAGDGDGEAPPMPNFVEIEKLAMPDPVEFMSAQPLEILLLEICSRFTRKLNNMEMQMQTLAASVDQRRNGNGNSFHVPPPQPVPVGGRKEGKTRVAIVGLWKEQFEHVKEKCGDRVELVFVDKDVSATNYPPSVQKVIVQKHSRHRWFEQAREKFGNDNVFFVDGGMTAVIQKVFDISSRP